MGTAVSHSSHVAGIALVVCPGDTAATRPIAGDAAFVSPAARRAAEISRHEDPGALAVIFETSD